MLVLGFDRTKFDGQVMPELARLKEAGIVRTRSSAGRVALSARRPPA
jgi:hypothetical protein